MINLFRTVDASVWSLSPVLGDRRARLLEVPRPDVLLAMVRSEADMASRQGSIHLKWEQSCESPGHFRLVAQIPLCEATFDQFFNGRSGYRAQYYLSPEEGVLFNRAAIRSLWPILLHAERNQPLDVDHNLLELSLHGPHSKIWVLEDKQAFDDAVVETVNPERWVKSGKCRGRRAPLPDHLIIDVKGTFIHPKTLDVFIDECKLDRACDLFIKGFT